jgi:hypothetical protein
MTERAYVLLPFSFNPASEQPAEPTYLYPIRYSRMNAACLCDTTTRPFERGRDATWLGGVHSSADLTVGNHGPEGDS